MAASSRLPPLIPDHIPQPPCTALSSMVWPPRWQQCASDANLASFIMYTACYASDDEVRELAELPVVYHVGKVKELLMRPVVGVVVDDEYRQLPKIVCIDGDCEQCANALGGYTFFWVDMRWTPEAALLQHCAVEDMPLQLALPWPRGVLQVPRPLNCTESLSAVDALVDQGESAVDQRNGQVPLLLLHAPGFLTSSSRPLAAVVAAVTAAAELSGEVTPDPYGSGSDPETTHPALG